MTRLLQLVLIALLFVVAPTSVASQNPQEGPFADAAKLVAAGKLDEGKELAEAVLASHPFSVDGYLLMHKIAKLQDDLKSQLQWAKWAYWSYKYTGKSSKLESLLPLFEGQWEGWNKDEAILEEWEDSLGEAANKAAAKKQYRLAGHLMDRLLELNAGDKKLDKAYEKLADKAGQQLSGGAFTAASIRRKSADWLNKENKKHEHWQSPFERKTRHYDIYTNVSWEFAETVSSAMDEINEFYRSIYGYKKKARAKIHVMRKRSDFDKMALKVLGRSMPSRGVGGYWVATQKAVVAYDRAYDEEGFTQDALWNTLFHEASHQFMTLLTKGRHLPPCWLNEGTATYFEGCEIKADGTIVKNAPALHRLRSWYHLDNSERKHSLEELIAHDRNLGADSTGSNSYEGEYYSYGWALVYFLLNYEENDRRVYGQAVTDDGKVHESYKEVRKAGKLVYREAYDKYLAHFSERGSKGDKYYALEMAKKFFVEEIDDPDVPDWEAFEKRWRKYCTSLYHEEQSGPEFADVDQARARGYMLAEDYERARVAAEFADRKRGDDPETYRLLGLASAGEGREADGIYWMVRHWEKVWPAGQSEAADEAEQWMLENGGKDVVKFYVEPTKLAVQQLQDACDEALKADQPLAAVLFAEHGSETIAMDHHELSKHIGLGLEPGEENALEASGQDLRMWQRAYEKGEEANRQYLAPGIKVDLVRYEKDGLFMNNPEAEGRPGMEKVGRRSLEYLQPPYEIRGKVQVEGGQGLLYMGLDFGGRARSAMVFGFEEGAPVLRFCRVDLQLDVDAGRAIPRETVFAGYQLPEGDKIDFHMVVNKGEEESYFTANGTDKLALSLEDLPSRRLTGGMALTCTDGSVALWQDLEVRPSRPFWPVP
jgi:hypothetical protein